MNLINGIAFINVIILLIIICIDYIVHSKSFSSFEEEKSLKWKQYFIFSEINKREIAFDRSRATY